MTYEMVGDTYLEALLDLTRLKALPGFDINSDLGRAIQSLRDKYADEAESHLRVAAKKKSGRPKKMELLPHGPEKGLIGSNVRQKPAKKPVGRPTERPKNWDIRIFELVEAQRKEIADNNLSKPTVAAAIESFLRLVVAKKLGVSESSAVKKWTNVTKAAYARGKKTVNTKENQN